MPLKTVDVSVEYSKNQNLRKDDIDALEQWLEKQPHLPKLTELQLILFLHSCYYKLDATKSTIDSFFSFKTNFTDVFANRDPNLPRNKAGMECGLFAQLPKRSPEGYMILFFTFIDGDAAHFIGTDQMKLFDMCVRLWLLEEGTSEGLLFIVDMKQFSFSHVMKASLFSIKNFFGYLQEALPVRFKGMHFVNAGGAAEKLMNMSKPFIKAELRDAINLYGDISENFYKVVPKECLPKDYGGSAESISDLHDMMKKKLLDSADYFIEEEQQRSDESKRIGKINDFFTTDYGVEGSFKKLELD